MFFNAIYIDSTTVELYGGQIIRNFHREFNCWGDHCPVHNPSEHEYADDPLFFNGSSFYRVSAGKLVVDPDDYAYNSGMTVILRNSAKCHNCGDEVHSTFRHHFVECSCGNIFTDGGNDYIRQGWNEKKSFENTSITFKK